MKSHNIAIGDRFGLWTVIGVSIRKKFGVGRSANYPLLFPCRCDCGMLRDVRAFKLLSNSRSCGCATVGFKSSASTIHGHNRPGKRTRLYRTWDGMTQRCTNENHQNFPDYGGRGIAVCSVWQDFQAFAAWALSSGQTDSAEIDRIDNDGPYSPDNCRWVSSAHNKRNTRQTYFVEAFGETKCLTDWALDPRCAVTPQTIKIRIEKLGLSAEAAISSPRKSRKRAGVFKGNHF